MLWQRSTVAIAFGVDRCKLCIRFLSNSSPIKFKLDSLRKPADCLGTSKTGDLKFSTTSIERTSDLVESIVRKLCFFRSWRMSYGCYTESDLCLCRKPYNITEQKLKQL
jgi:hypothetical protein